MKRTRRYTSYKRTCPTKKLGGSSVLVPVLACIAIIFTFVILFAWNFEAGEMASMLNILALGLGWGVSFGSLMLYTPQVTTTTTKMFACPLKGISLIQFRTIYAMKQIWRLVRMLSDLNATQPAQARGPSFATYLLCVIIKKNISPIRNSEPTAAMQASLIKNKSHTLPVLQKDDSVQ